MPYISNTPAPSIALAEGSTTTIRINVTAQDGVTTRCYTIMIARDPSNDAQLSDLEVSYGALLQAFQSSTMAYSMQAPHLPAPFQPYATLPAMCRIGAI